MARRLERGGDARADLRWRSSGRIERLAGPLLFAGALVPVAAPQRNLRGAFLLLGVPWLAFFAARSLPLVGHFSTYSNDDWLVYQVAGYRIFMNGFWLQGGSRTCSTTSRSIDGSPERCTSSSVIRASARPTGTRPACCGRPAGVPDGQKRRRFSRGRCRGRGDAGDLHARHDLVLRRPGSVGDGREPASCFWPPFYLLRARLGGTASAVTAGRPGCADVLHAPQPSVVRFRPARFCCWPLRCSRRD